MLTRNLINWDSITETKEYIYNQIPEIISFIVEQPFSEVNERFDLCYCVEEIDFSGLTLLYLGIIGGASLAMGLKFAGTGNQKAKKLIIDEISNLKKIKILKNDFAIDKNNKGAIDSYNLFNLFCVHLLSLSLIMAGTCDIEC